MNIKDELRALKQRLYALESKGTPCPHTTIETEGSGITAPALKYCVTCGVQIT